VTDVAFAFAAAVLAGTTTADGVAANDWARAAEKSSVAVAAVVVFVEEADVAVEARAVRSPGREWSTGLDGAERILAEDLELDESELPWAGRSVLEDPRLAGWGVFSVAGFPRAGSLPRPAALEAASGGLAAGGLAVAAGAGDGAAAGTGSGLNVSIESAAMGECPARPELL